MSDSAKNERVFEDLFQKLYPRLCFYATSIIHDEEEAKDVVQQVFVQLWNNKANLNWSLDLKSYIFRCVYNAALNFIRQDRVRRSFFDFLRQNEIDFEDEVDHTEKERLLQKIEELIASMPEQMREIFLLNRFVGRTSVDIAQELNLSIRTVENQIYRAMKFLREKLDSSSRDELLLLLFLLK